MRTIAIIFIAYWFLLGHLFISVGFRDKEYSLEYHGLVWVILYTYQRIRYPLPPEVEKTFKKIEFIDFKITSREH